jgi:hypothetical protein
MKEAVLPNLKNMGREAILDLKQLLDTHLDDDIYRVEVAVIMVKVCPLLLLCFIGFLFIGFLFQVSTAVAKRKCVGGSTSRKNMR